MGLARPLACALLAILAGCGKGHAPPAPARPRPVPIPAACVAGRPGLVCGGDVATTCSEDGRVLSARDCAAEALTCATGIGCVACVPSASSCDGDTRLVCRADASGWDRGVACDRGAGLRCSADGCADLCARAVESRSYIGCEYWAVPLMNTALAPEFHFAVVVANPQLVTAEVVVERVAIGAGGARTFETLEARAVAPGALEIVELPWVASLKGEPGQVASVLAPASAYRVRSDVPVTAYQFNPIEYRVGTDCTAGYADRPGDDVCFSYTNDASLLLPSHVLTGNYLGLSRQTQLLIDEAYGPGSTSGFVAIVGVTADPVDVEVRFAGRSASSLDGSIAAQREGETASYRLARGDVLELASAALATCDGASRSERVGGRLETYCDVSRAYDLTGTEIRASGPVGVFGGHDCTFVPYDRWACDHLEEMLFPLESWGRDYVVAVTAPLEEEPNVVRIVSARDGNRIELDPPLVEAMTLDRGQFVELEVRESFRVRGSDPLIAVQMLVGQEYAGIGSVPFGANGDPAMALAIPVEQYRTSYEFLAPATYRLSFVSVVAPNGTDVVLDGRLVGGFRAVGASGYRVAAVEIDPGAHAIRSVGAFGITMYGFGSFTSYLYPGGLDLRAISSPF